MGKDLSCASGFPNPVSAAILAGQSCDESRRGPVEG